MQDTVMRLEATARNLRAAAVETANALGNFAIAGIDDHDYTLRRVLDDLRKIIMSIPALKIAAQTPDEAVPE